MYKNVLKQHIIALILLFTSCFIAIQASAQASSPAGQPANTLIAHSTQAHAETSRKPVKRFQGYSFNDFYYTAHAKANTLAAISAPAATSRGSETNYNSVPTYRNFQFWRIYLGYDYEKKFSAEALLASEPNTNPATATGTPLAILSTCIWEII